MSGHGKKRRSAVLSRPDLVSRFHFFGEPMGLILGTAHQRIECGQAATLSIAGAESNVAIGLARLGHQCVFHSALGADPYGERIIRTLRAEMVDVGNVKIIPGEVTGLITRNCFPWREPDVFYHRQSSAFAEHGEAAAEAVKFSAGDMFFTTGITIALGESSLRAVTRLVERARQAEVVVCIDVNYRRKLWDKIAFRQALHPLLCQIDILFLGREEGQILTGLSGPAAMAKWLLQQGAKEVIIKDGSKGAWHFTLGQAGLHGKPFSLRAIVDSIGAGDAFDAGFLGARVQGQTRSGCLRSGNALGALVCLTPGDWESLPTPKELQSFLRGDIRAVR